ncbi:MAG TPA: hypothetical protein VN648_08700 [Candidatus Methylomirabilis sp.]|nr:hypothetical protein [Candidatus Methylomirabilis sp.]
MTGQHGGADRQVEYRNMTLLNRLESGSAVIGRSRLVGPAASNPDLDPQVVTIARRGVPAYR